MGAPARKSKLGLFVGLGVVVVGGAVLAIVLVMRGGKGGGSSRDGVINDTFAAMSAGDGDKLVKLGNVADLISAVIECKDSDDDQDSKKKKKHDDDDDDFDMRHPDKLADKLAKETRRVADATKGAQIEVVSIDTDPMPALEPDKDDDKSDKGDDDSKERRHKHDRDDDTHVNIQHKGDKAGDGCKFKKSFQSQRVAVRLKITEPDRDPDKQKVDVEITEVDGRYYLTDMPKVKMIGATIKMAGFIRDDMCACTDKKCADKTDREYRQIDRMGRDIKDKLTKDDKDKAKSIDKEYKACRKKVTGKGGGDVDEALAKMTEMSDRMCACKDKACADGVNDDYKKWGEEMSKNAAADMETPDAETMKKMTDVMTKFTECASKAMTEQAPPPPPPPPPPQIEFQPAPADMPQPCHDFRAELQRIATCDKFPAAAKDSLRQSWDALVGAWGSTPANARNAMSDTCKSSLDAVKQGSSTLCP